MVHGQNYNNANHRNWGAKPFNDQKRRSKGGKFHRSKHNNQPSPAWKAQAPPPPPPPMQFAQSEGIGSGHDMSAPVAVNVQGLPPALCRQNFLEAMLEQAGFADDVMGCILGEEAGQAVIYLASYDAAVKTVAHFAGRRWANAGPPVTATVADGRGPPSVKSPIMTPMQQPHTATGNEKPWNMGVGGMAPPMPAVHGSGCYAILQPVGCPVMQMPPNCFQSGGVAMPNSIGDYSPSKARWADVADEGDNMERVSEDQESTSAGSTGRASHEVTLGFFPDTDDSPFACDTDDGF